MKSTQLVKATCLSALFMLTCSANVHAAKSYNTAGNQKGADQKSALSGKSTISIKNVGTTKWEYFKVGKDATTGGSLSPRAERGLNPPNGDSLEGRNLTDGKKVIILKGQCKIESCARSTIVQIFNYDGRTSDKAKPYFFLEAMSPVKDWRGNISGWNMKVTGFTGWGSNSFTVDNKPFDFEVRTNNKRVKVRITQNGSSKFNKAWDFDTANTSGRAGVTRFRYGCYHHQPKDAGGTIRFRNTKSSTYTPRTPNTGV